MHNKAILLAKLENALEHIIKIEEYTLAIKSHEDYYTTKQGQLLFDASMMRLQALGENLKQLEHKAPELFLMHKNIEWIKIIRFRDIISHHYEKLESEIIYDVCSNFIPLVKMGIQKIINELANS